MSAGRCGLVCAVVVVMEAVGAGLLVVNVGFVCDAYVDVVHAIGGLVYIVAAVSDVVIVMLFSVGVSGGLTDDVDDTVGGIVVVLGGYNEVEVEKLLPVMDKYDGVSVTA